MIDFVKIKQYRDQINQLLTEKPELIPFQKEIDRELEKAGKNHGNRMSVLFGMLMARAQELQSKLIGLRDSLSELSQIAKENKDETTIH